MLFRSGRGEERRGGKRRGINKGSLSPSVELVLDGEFSVSSLSSSLTSSLDYSTLGALHSRGMAAELYVSLSPSISFSLSLSLSLSLSVCIR